ncbi:YezD family protein [Alkalihalobacillus pseudalcaliphilus]|uniref:YezD family protein n=1 Tax=Alkalihalobacillus pseudalcaliphilus TaxID=79884 RepID=UPI0009FF325B|nr:YezD family protein [Alkalihalobacillus pseudalcaliphilus]
MGIFDKKKQEEIKKAIEKIEYGTVLITIHDNQITQIDATEKVRFSPNKKNQLK